MTNEVGPVFFGKMGIPLIAGREFTDSDNLAGPKVAIVNEQFVKKILNGRSPMGVRFGSAKLEIEIVGVVKNSHYAGVKQAPPELYYTPWRQDKEINSLAFYVRSALPAAQIIRRSGAWWPPSITTPPEICAPRRSDSQQHPDRPRGAAACRNLCDAGHCARMLGSTASWRTASRGGRARSGSDRARRRAGADSRMVMREMTWILARAWWSVCPRRWRWPSLPSRSCSA